MHTAELLTAGAMMLLSVVFMISATALPIGWVEYAGPGGGAFPFWLGLIMLISSAAIFVREYRAFAARHFEDTRFTVGGTWQKVLVVTIALVVTVALLPIAGTYISLPLFLLFYLRALGHHGWKLVLPIVLGTPLILFFFFEVTLKILLPKGYTEPLFIPLYAIFF